MFLIKSTPTHFSFPSPPVPWCYFSLPTSYTPLQTQSPLGARLHGHGWRSSLEPEWVLNECSALELASDILRGSLPILDLYPAGRCHGYQFAACYVQENCLSLFYKLSVVNSPSAGGETPWCLPWSVLAFSLDWSWVGLMLYSHGRHELMSAIVQMYLGNGFAVVFP